MNEQKRAFTLIELLIVVAIIAILAAIAVPNFLEAQVRSKVARAQNDMRSIATGLEAYAVDYVGRYPISTCRSKSVPSGCLYNTNSGNTGWYNVNYCNAGLPDSSWERATFACNGPTQKQANLTTPIAYMSKHPADPFADAPGIVYGYTNMGNAVWLLSSYGPDCDEACDDTAKKGGGQITRGRNADGSVLVPQVSFALCNKNNLSPWTSSASPWTWEGAGNTLYSDTISTPSATFLTAGYTYDSTNGSKSSGDIWRCKQ
ncbi:TPA: hypothetical protein DDW35_00165 [Candidatus Sumerlaeota bacterium]|nr:hypothetical protein [Candidatus Sumerlaeota bacterium]